VIDFIVNDFSVAVGGCFAQKHSSKVIGESRFLLQCIAVVEDLLACAIIKRVVGVYRPFLLLAVDKECLFLKQIPFVIALFQSTANGIGSRRLCAALVFHFCCIRKILPEYTRCLH